MKNLLIIITVSFFIAASVFGQDISTLRKGEAIAEQSKTSPIPKPITNDIKVSRNYPMQPPIIPHNIRDYQVDINVNTCLSCHNRNRIGDSQATMVSVTHYMDRDGNFLAQVSPRRYFCTQCHVTQHDTKPLVPNTFVDMDKIIALKTKKDK
jgi:cytochrome c-type protein NapB